MNHYRTTLARVTSTERAGAFETDGYRKAVESFLREFFPSAEHEESLGRLSVHQGLKMIRSVIERRAGQRKAPASS